METRSSKRRRLQLGGEARVFSSENHVPAHQKSKKPEKRSSVSPLVRNNPAHTNENLTTANSSSSKCSKRHDSEVVELNREESPLGNVKSSQPNQPENACEDNMKLEIAVEGNQDVQLVSFKLKNTEKLSGGEDHNLENERSVAISSRVVEEADTGDRSKKSHDLINAGFHFFLQRLGGMPRQSDIRRLKAELGYCFDSEEEDSFQSPPKEHCENRSGSHNGERSPICDDFNNEDMFRIAEDDDMCTPRFEKHDKDETGENLLATYLEGNAVTKRSDLGANGVQPNIFPLRPPSKPIVFPDFIIPELLHPERSGLLPKTIGNAADDEFLEASCEGINWIMGAEKFVGRFQSDNIGGDENASRSNFRQIWSAMLESGVLRNIGSAGGLSDLETRVVTGICLRLLACNTDINIISVLAKELLDIRKAQISSGFDSLSIFISAQEGGTVPLRHTAIAAIWASAIRRAAHRGNHFQAWPMINKAFDSSFSEFLDMQSGDEKNLKQGKSDILSVVSGLIVIAYMFEVRFDYDDEVGNISNKGDSYEPCSENWVVICGYLRRLSERCTVNDGSDKMRKLLQFFIHTFTAHIPGKIWPVTENLLSATSKAIAIVSSTIPQSCYCVKAPMIASRFSGVAGLGYNPVDTGNHLNTPCDCLLYLGWLYAQAGNGNIMKRSMNVMKNGALFTKGKNLSSTSSSRAVNHHIGLLLTVADGLSSSSKNGEFLFCRMLTSKCPLLISVAEHVAKEGTENDLGWNAVMEAISVRCKILLAQGKDVAVYVCWLSQNMVNHLMLMRKSAERNVKERKSRELKRAQESIFSTLATTTFRILSNIARDLTWKLQEESENALRNARLAVCQCSIHLRTLVKFGIEVVGQIDENMIESVAKKRHLVLDALTAVIEEEMKLCTEVWTAQRSQQVERESTTPPSSALILEPFVTGDDIEAFLATLIGLRCDMNEGQWSQKVKKRAANMLSIFISMRWLSRKTVGVSEALNSVRNTIRSAKIDKVCNNDSHTGLVGKQAYECSDVVSLRFWSQSLSREWGQLIVERDFQMRTSCTSVLLWNLVSENEDWEKEDRDALRQLASELKNVGNGREVLGELWDCIYESKVDGYSNSVPDEGISAKVNGVEFALRRLATRLPFNVMSIVLTGIEKRSAKKMKDRKTLWANDGVTLYTFCLTLKSQLIGFSSGTGSRWMNSFLEEIYHCVTRLRNRKERGWWVRTMKGIQRRVMGALAMTSRDNELEKCVLVVRLLNVLGENNTLEGVWQDLLLPEEGVNEEWVRRAKRNREGWCELALHSVVEEVLLRCEQAAARTAMHKLVAALRHGVEKARETAVRLKNGGFAGITDGVAWREWQEVLDMLNNGDTAQL